ncbi:hypothetical protein ACIGXU_24325 [Streptomyces lydicus]|uniref:hypothetical protein n=1 Tax=Streptomyces lydicus TaxID=47763 RepID=UPI0037D41E39
MASFDLHERGHVDARLVQDRAGGVATPLVQAVVVDPSLGEQLRELLPTDRRAVAGCPASARNTLILLACSAHIVTQKMKKGGAPPPA